MLAAEYLGTTQIVTARTAYGPVKLRLPADRSIAAGAQVGLHFDPKCITVFDTQGRALRSAANEKVLAHG